MLLLLLLGIVRLRLGRMRYDRLTVLQLLALNCLLLLLLNELRTLNYLHYLIAWAHNRVLLNDGLRRRWPQLVPSTRWRKRSRSGCTGCATNDDTAAQATVTAGRDQDRTATTTGTAVGTRNRAGTRDGTSHKGHGLGLLLLLVVLDMLLKCFFRRFRAT